MTTPGRIAVPADHMLNLKRISEYMENNRIEAKTALGGFPESVWETYSAFANTMGGYILLGVSETSAHDFNAVGLPDPEKLLAEFYVMVNDPKKASCNILSPKDLFIAETAGGRIAVIHVPRAKAADLPIYIGGDPRNAYIRKGEGDHRMSDEERQKMLRYKDALLRIEKELAEAENGTGGREKTAEGGSGSREKTPEGGTGGREKTAEGGAAGREKTAEGGAGGREKTAEGRISGRNSGRNPGKVSDKDPGRIPDRIRYAAAIVVYLTEHASAGMAEIAEYLGISRSSAGRYIKRLIEKNIAEKLSGGSHTKYRLKR